MTHALTRSIGTRRHDEGLSQVEAEERAAGSDECDDPHLALAPVQQLIPEFSATTALVVHASSMVAARIDSGDLFSGNDDVIVRDATDSTKDAALSSIASPASEINTMTSRVIDRMKSDVGELLRCFQSVDVCVLQRIVALFKGTSYVIMARFSP